MLKKLIEILSDDTIEEGRMVRFITSSNSMRIPNLDTKTVEERKLSPPNPEHALQAAIEANKDKSKDEATNNFLGF